jgi:hypothetical protein
MCGPIVSIDKFMDDITTGPKESDGTTSGMGNDYEIFSNLVPCPEELKEVTSRFGTVGDDDPEKEQKKNNVESHGAVDWYEWCCTSQQTKWGDNQTHLVHEDLCTPYSTADDDEVSLKKVMLRFDSAWSPPIEGMDVVAAKYPDIMFDLRFWEPGMGFQNLRSNIMSGYLAATTSIPSIGGDQAESNLSITFFRLTSSSSAVL